MNDLRCPGFYVGITQLNSDLMRSNVVWWIYFDFAAMDRVTNF